MEPEQFGLQPVRKGEAAGLVLRTDEAVLPGEPAACLEAVIAVMPDTDLRFVHLQIPVLHGGQNVQKDLFLGERADLLEASPGMADLDLDHAALLQLSDMRGERSVGQPQRGGELIQIHGAVLNQKVDDLHAGFRPQRAEDGKSLLQSVDLKHAPPPFLLCCTESGTRCPGYNSRNSARRW